MDPAGPADRPREVLRPGRGLRRVTVLPVRAEEPAPPVAPVVADVIDRSARLVLGLAALGAAVAREILGVEPAPPLPGPRPAGARPPIPQALPGALVAVGRRLRRTVQDAVATTERTVATGVGLVTRPAPIRALVERLAEPIVALDREAATAVSLDRTAAGDVLRTVVQRAVVAVLDEVDLDAVVARVDIDAIIAERVDIDRIVHRLDIDRIIAEQVDIGAIIDMVDINAILDKIDLNAVIAEKVNLDAIIDEVDIDRLLDRLDFTAIVQERVDLGGLANDVVDEIELPALVRSSTSSLAGDTLDAVRRQGMTADDLVARIVDTVLFRRRNREVELPPSEDGAS